MSAPSLTAQDLDRIEAMAAGPAHVWSEEDAALVLQLVREARERRAAVGERVPVGASSL